MLGRGGGGRRGGRRGDGRVDRATREKREGRWRALHRKDARRERVCCGGGDGGGGWVDERGVAEARDSVRTASARASTPVVLAIQLAWKTKLRCAPVGWTERLMTGLCVGRHSTTTRGSRALVAASGGPETLTYKGQMTFSLLEAGR